MAAVGEAAVPPGDRHAAPWVREVLAGFVGAVVMLAVVLTIGLIGVAPLGAEAAPQGVARAFVAAIVGGLIFALISRSAMPAAGPSSATALIYAAALVPLVRDPAVAAGGGLSLVFLAGGTLVMATGLLQIVLAVVGLGRLARFVPQPVLAGFMNGVAVLIFLAQLPALLGVAHGASLAGWQPAALAVGLLTAGLTGLMLWRWPRAPAQLIGLAGGVVVFYALQQLAPGLALGGSVGALPSDWPRPDIPLRWFSPGSTEFLVRHAPGLLAAAAVLALIGSLESVLSGMAIDQMLDTRHDARRDLLGLGVSNLAIGLFGGLPAVVLRARALATLNAGGSGRRAAIAGALAFGLMFAMLGPWIARLPLVVLAGIMVTVAFGLLDRWTRQLVAQWRAGERSAESWQALAVVAFVCTVTVWKGFVIGGAAGVRAATAVFVRSLDRTLLRVRLRGGDAPSRRIYPESHEVVLQVGRDRIEVLMLGGPLFFGNAARLAEVLSSLRPATRFVVVDLATVSTIDASGATVLQQEAAALCRHGVALLLAGVTESHAHGRRLRAFGCFRESPRSDWFADVDRAVEWAERQLLAEAGLGLGGVAVPLSATNLFRGLDEAQTAQLEAVLLRRRLGAGETLFREGDAADGLYVLTRGSVSVLAGAGSASGGRRFLSFSPGLMLGETAMLDGGGRSATALADEDSELWQLTPEALAALGRDAPSLAVAVHRNIAVHLAQRLRQSTARRPRPAEAQPPATP
jgi:SulP family sulfate permease